MNVKNTKNNINEISKQLFKKDVTINFIKKCLKSDTGLLRVNAIRSLIYNNIVDEEIVNLLKDIAINGNFKLIGYTERDFATPALHILGYKKIPLTEWGEKILKAKDDVFTKWD